MVYLFPFSLPFWCITTSCAALCAKSNVASVTWCMIAAAVVTHVSKSCSCCAAEESSCCGCRLDSVSVSGSEANVDVDVDVETDTDLDVDADDVVSLPCSLICLKFLGQRLSPHTRTSSSSSSF